MDQIYDNRYYSAGSREPSPRRARTVQLGGSAYAGADRSTAPDKYLAPQCSSGYFDRWTSAPGTFVACSVLVGSNAR